MPCHIEYQTLLLNIFFARFINNSPCHNWHLRSQGSLSCCSDRHSPSGFLINYIAWNYGTGYQRITFIQTDDTNSLSIAADGVDVRSTNALDLASGCHHQDFVRIDDRKHIDNFAVAFGRLDVADTLAATALTAVLIVAGN